MGRQGKGRASEGQSDEMSEDEIFEPDGRINLPPPTAEALEQAAEDVLGPTATEALFPAGGKLFRGSVSGGFFLQGPEESAGVVLSQAGRELQDELIVEAQKVRKARAEEDRADYLDPAKNPLIKIPD